MEWETEQNILLLNPRLPDKERLHAQKLFQALPEKGYFVLGTSGSTGSIKWVVLSKKAVLASAAAVNTHLSSNAQDRWLLVLPTFHVGGLGILARVYLSHSHIIQSAESWDPHHFQQLVQDEQITLTSLVPTQVYDLVVKNLKAPKSLRGIVVGGGALHKTLYEKAASLGWPLLPSYGMTETASQVATASNMSSSLQLLTHLQAKIDSNGYLCLKGPSLFSGYLQETASGIQLIDPKIDGWFVTEDLAEINKNQLIIKGRSKNFIKIGGESVDLSHLEGILEELKLKHHFSADCALVANPDERLGHVIHFLVTKIGYEQLVEAFNVSVMPYERIRKVQLRESLKRSPLGKLILIE